MADAASAAAVMLVAILADALTGEPEALYRRVPHPVALLGRLVLALEGTLRRVGDRRWRQTAGGVVLVVVVAGAAASIGWGVERAASAVPGGWVVAGVVASCLLAQRSLVQHVAAVAAGLRRSLADGRAAVRRIVGRDPERLDEAAVGRAAVESLAENLSDGVIAPVLWGLLLGLPGLCAYKAVNTLDSMVGHRDDRYRHFGWASARLDDLVNVPASRLTALLLVLAAVGGASPRGAIRAVRCCARRHRSPNAGWPEAAMAGALGLRLAGPRSYGGHLVDDAWMGDGRAEVGPEDIERGIRLAWRAWAIMVAALAGLVIVG